MKSQLAPQMGFLKICTPFINDGRRGSEYFEKKDFLSCKNFRKVINRSYFMDVGGVFSNICPKLDAVLYHIGRFKD